ncbi:MAG: hypothetical protein LBQ47_03420 [Endomicrobium sp.]|jgi:hypothetical protein|nr:hypothetical protein [Endomicrobium sp.]
MNKIILHILILAGICALLYLGNFTNSYSYYDDYQEIVLNKYLNPQLNSPLKLFTDFNFFHFYVPFKHLTNYCLNFVFGYNPHVSHLLSDFIHIFNVILCYLLILRLSKSYAAAFFTALLFGVSPVCSNAVNEIAARGHLFTVFFGFLSFYIYTFTHASGLKRNQSRHFTAIAVLLYAAGLLFWPTVIVLPALLAVYEFAVYREKKNSAGAVVSVGAQIKKVFFKILPFAVTACAFIALNLYISHLRNSMFTQSAVFDNGLIFSVKLFGWQSFYKIPAIIAHYLAYSFVPPFFDIIFAPPLALFSQTPFVYLGSFALILLFAFISFKVYKKNQTEGLLGTSFFVLFLLPGIAVMYKSELISLRYMYAACIGIFFIACSFAKYYIIPYLTGYKKYAGLTVFIAFFVFSFSNSFSRKYMWKDPQTVTDAMIVNGGLSQVWGWALKINWIPEMKNKLAYLQEAGRVLEENKYGYDLQYDLIKQNLEGRIEFIKQLESSAQK